MDTISATDSWNRRRKPQQGQGGRQPAAVLKAARAIALLTAAGRTFTASVFSVLCGLCGIPVVLRSALYPVLRVTLCIAALLPALHISTASALTPVGTAIANRATLSYSQGNAGVSVVSSNITSFVVQELTDVSVQWQDGSAVPAGSPDTARALTFSVTNTGNGQRDYTLEREPVAIAGQFVPQPAAIGVLYVENGLQAGFQAHGAFADRRYRIADALPVAAGASITVYVVSDIPADTASGSLGTLRLKAVSANAAIAAAAPGSTLAGAGAGGVDAVVAHGQAHGDGSYEVSELVVTLEKTVTDVKDPLGGSTLMSGSRIGYRITARLLGTGMAEDLVISDPLPAVLRYLPGSLRVNGSARTDIADNDGAQAAGNTITIRAGDVAAPAVWTIDLHATVE